MNEWRRASESMWLSPVRTSALFQTPTASAQGSKMSQSFRWWRGAKWQSGVQRVLPFPIQVFKTWSLITPLSCCTVNILPRRTADMTFTIPFTSIYTARSLLLGFFTFASKKIQFSMATGLNLWKKSLLSPCFVRYGCFSHLYTRIQNRSVAWWQRLIQLKGRKRGLSHVETSPRGVLTESPRL